MKSPCKECPFRKDSMKGWLGPYKTPQDLINAGRGSESGMYKCHMEVNEKMEYMDGFDAHLQASPCRGALIMMKKSCHRPRNPKTVALMEQVTEENKKQVLAEWEVLEHHNIENIKSKLRKK